MADFPWKKSYPNNISWDFKGTSKPVYKLFEEAVKNYPTRNALSFLGKKLTYRDVHRQINQMAVGLQNLGVKKGDRIGICLPNCPYFVVTYFAALKVGAIVVHFNPLYTQDEILDQIKDSGVSLMVTADLKIIYKKVKAALGESSLRTIVVCPFLDILPFVKSILFRLFKWRELATITYKKGVVPLFTLMNKGFTPKFVEIDPDTDIALIQYTGGTTGVPKGAMLTHTNIMSNTHQVHVWRGQPPKSGEKVMAVLPFFHVFAMTACMNLGIANAAELVMLPRLDMKQLLKTLQKEKITFFPGVPSLFLAILNVKNIKKFDLTSIQYCISGGAALPLEIRKQFEKMTTCILVEGYGLTESSPVAACNHPNNNKAGSIGLPLPGTEIEIRNMENIKKCVKAGETGEIFVKGPQIMQGYWNKKQATEEALQNGWLSTGDVGHIDEDGYVFLTDRLKEIIITNGYNVYPRVIEEAFYTHADVEEVSVIGIPHKEKGETPKAFIKLKSGANVTQDDMLVFIKEKLNPIERPDFIEFRKKLPKTMIGKLSKKELVEEEKQKRT